MCENVLFAIHFWFQLHKKLFLMAAITWPDVTSDSY